MKGFYRLSLKQKGDFNQAPCAVRKTYCHYRRICFQHPEHHILLVNFLRRTTRLKDPRKLTFWKPQGKTWVMQIEALRWCITAAHALHPLTVHQHHVHHHVHFLVTAIADKLHALFALVWVTLQVWLVFCPLNLLLVGVHCNLNFWKSLCIYF